MLDKDTIMKKAIEDCLEEMFQKSQPKASYFDYVEKLKRGEISKEEKVFDLIKDIKDFYEFDKDETQFDFNVYLGCSPISNAETVKEYWKSQGIDIEIDTTELSEDQYWELDNYGHLLEEKEE